MESPWYWKVRKGWYLWVTRPDGTRTRVRLGGTREAADAKLKTLQSQTVTVEGGTVESIALRFLIWVNAEHTASRLSESRYRTLRYYLTQFIAAVGARNINDVRPLEVMEWLGTKTSWGRTSRFNAVGAIRRCYKWATQNGLANNPFIGALTVPSPKARDFLVSRELHARMVQSCGAHKFATRRVRSFRLVLIAMWLTGARPNELTEIPKASAGDERWEIANHKTKAKGKRRYIYPNPCMQTVAKLLAARSGDHPKLFGSAKYSDWRRRFERLRKQIKGPDEFVLYSYRHTWITSALESGIDVATVAELAGTSVTMISRHYGHLGQRSTHLKDAALLASQKRK